MTIEDLAQITAKGFADVDKRIEDVALATASGFAELHGRFSQLDHQVRQNTRALNTLEMGMSNVEHRLDVLSTHERRLLELEKKA